MTDKELVEHNSRWLTALRQDIARLQEHVLGASARCTSDSPAVDWDQIKFRIDLMKNITSFAHEAIEGRPSNDRGKSGAFFSR